MKNRIHSTELASIFIVVILFLAIFPSSVNAIKLDGTLSNYPSTDFNDDYKSGEYLNSCSSKKFLNQHSPLKDRLDSFRQQIKDFIDSRLENKCFANNKSSKTILGDFYSVLSSIKAADSSLRFFVNYSGSIKSSKLGLFSPVNIDINGDKKDDINAKLILYPSIVRPFSLAVNLKFEIRKLNGFDNLDDNAYFKAYAKYVRPGFFNKEWKNDAVNFGFESPAGNKIPDSCDVVYTYVPHLLSFSEKPEHRVTIKPDQKSVSNVDLNLVLEYIDQKDGNVVSEDEFKVCYSPAAETTISMGRLGDGRFEFNRERTKKTNVDLLLTHKENNGVYYLFLKKLPTRLKFELDMGEQGHVKFNSYDESISEVGICDDLQQPSYKLNFTNLYNEGTVNWQRDFEEGKIKIDVLTKGNNIGFNTWFRNQGIGEVDLGISSQQNLDCSFKIDLSEGYVSILRSKVDLLLSLKVEIINETMGEYLSYLEGSCVLSKSFETPFEIRFKSLEQGDIEFSLAGTELDLFDVNFDVSSSVIGGTLSVEMDHLYKNKNGSVSTSINVENTDDYIQGSCLFEVVRGVKITGFTLKYNDMIFYQENLLDISGSKTSWYNFTFDIDIEWHVYDGWGYVLITSGSLTQFSFNSVYEDEHGKEIGRVSGVIHFDTLGETLNISWKTVEGRKFYTIDGMALIEINDFIFQMENKVDISISSLKGKFKLVNASEKSGFLQLDIENDDIDANLNMDVSLCLQNETFDDERPDYILNLSIKNLYVSNTDTTAFLEASWKNYNTTYLLFKSQGNVDIGVEDLDLYRHKRGEERNYNLTIVNLSGYLTGHVGLDAEIVAPAITVNLTDTDMYLRMDNLSTVNASGNVTYFGRIIFDAQVTGTTSFHPHSYITCLKPIKYTEPLKWHNFTIDIDATQGDLFIKTLDIENLYIWGTFNISNFSINGFSSVRFKLGVFQESLLPLFVGLNFTNDYGTSVTFDNFSFRFPLDILPDYPFYIRIYDGILQPGCFDFVGRLFRIVEVNISDGSAVDHLAVEIGNPEFTEPLQKILENFTKVEIELPEKSIFSYLEFDEPFEYFNVDLLAEVKIWPNGTIASTKDYLYIETQNQSTQFDYFTIVTNEFINICIDALNLSLPYFENDVGLRFNNLDLQADEFYIHFGDLLIEEREFNWDNVSMEGYLKIIGGNDVWLLYNNSWQKLTSGGDGNSSIIVKPGHIRIIINEQLTLEEDTFVVDDYEVTIGGTFIADEGIIDIWWDIDTGEIIIETDTDVTIQDLVLDIAENMQVSAETLALDINYINGKITFNLEEEGETNLEIDANINSINTVDLQFKVQTTTKEAALFLSGNLDFTLNGDILIYTDLQDYLEINITNAYSTMDLEEFDIIVSDSVHESSEIGIRFSGDSMHLEGTGSLNLGETIVIDANINSFTLTNGNIKLPKDLVDITIQGEISGAFSGPLYVETDVDLNIIKLEMTGAGNVKLTDFEITLVESGTSLSGDILQFFFDGPAYFEMAEEIIIDSPISEIYAEQCRFNSPSINLNLDGDIDFSFIGRIYIIADEEFNILELDMEGSGEIKFTDFYIELANGNMEISGDVFRIVFNAPAFFKMTDEIIFDANISEIYLANCDFEFPSKNIDLDGDIDISFNGEIHLRSDTGLNNIQIELDGVGQIEFKDFEIDVNDGFLILEGDRLVVRGKGTLTVSNTIVLDAWLWSVYFENCYFQLTGYNVQLDGTIDTEDVMGGVYISANTDFSYFEIQIAVYGTLTISNYNMNVNNGDLVLSGNQISMTGLGYAKLGNTVEISAEMDSFEAENVYITSSQAQIGNIMLDCDLVLSTSGKFNVYTDLETYIEFEITGDSSTHVYGDIKVEINDKLEAEFLDVDFTAGELIIEGDSTQKYIFIGSYDTTITATFNYGEIKLVQPDITFSFVGSGSDISMQGDLEIEWTGSISPPQPDSLKINSENGFVLSLSPVSIKVNDEDLFIFGGSTEFNGLIDFDDIQWDYYDGLVGISISDQTDFTVYADVDLTFFESFTLSVDAYFDIQGSLDLEWSYDYNENVDYFHGVCTDFSFNGGISVPDVFYFDSDLTLDGEVTFDKDPAQFYVSASGSYYINLTIYAEIQHRISSIANSFDGYITAQWYDNPSGWDLAFHVQVNSFSHISELEIERRFVDKIVTRNLQITQASFTILYEHEDFYIVNFTGDISFDSFKYKDLIDTIAWIDAKYLSISGDFLLEDTGSQDTIYLESQSGFSITNSDGIIKVGDETFHPGFFIQGDLTVTTHEHNWDNIVYKCSNYSTEGGINTYIATQRGPFGLAVDLDIDPGYLEISIADFPLMYDGAVSIDSSYLTGQISVLFSFNNVYGANLSLDSWIDFDHYTINWDPVLGGLAPGDWQIDGTVDFGSDLNIDFSENIPESDWFNVYPACLPGNQAPVAVFTWSPQTPTIGETVTFDATGSYDPDIGGIVSYIRWDWGEGGGWTDWHFFNNNWKIRDHTYYSDGDYVVRCQVADLRGKQSEITSHTVTVSDDGGQWVLPDYHVDPDDAWTDETNAYDDNTDTKANCPIGGDYPKWSWVWTPYLELRFNTPIDISKIRFMAWYSSSHCRTINYVVYGDTTHSVSTSTYNNDEWYVDDMDVDNVYKTEIRFEVKRGLWDTVSPDLYEFQFYEI